MSVLADDAFAAGQRPAKAPRRQPTGFGLMAYRASKGVRSPTPYLMLFGISLWLVAYWMLCEGLQLPRFEKIPGPITILSDWLSRTPAQGTSVFTPEYYQHIYVSCRRIAIAFFLATLLGVPLGLLMGWSKTIKDYTFPVLETLRPIPIMAWVPLAILMFSGYETPVIFLATLASFFATTLNTMLGVQSIDESYFRAAGCLGSKKWDVFRHVVVPGALPFIFTGLQISVGVAWFSLVAAEMVSGDYGLGYLILSSYVNSVTVPMVIGMLTLGFVGWFSSAAVRWVGNRLMQWHVKALAMQGR
ncbi:ABC transporter permease [Hansschlegelia beijingensis]|uniref:NitT/TauT family transport system permease protein n=1 Tax=Hansschlegelia beijingensis TaxID=1133344 RepID=A0A7W6GE38_9HYPH|nr:ABC transporter permease [Hansschlegelia beijingensis]MBB3971673.1 NitT/TauT family transport system permease protein [Hansschlegelia beijingensis]